jgi:hypothetical protein
VRVVVPLGQIGGTWLLLTRLALQEILRYATKPGGSVAIVAAPGTEPRRLLEISAVDQLLPVHDTRDEALRRLSR